MWHDGITFTLTQDGISGNLENLLRDFLNKRNGKFSICKVVNIEFVKVPFMVFYCF